MLSASDPEREARKYEKLTGQTAKAAGAGFAIDLPLVSRLVFLAPDDLALELPGTLFAPPPSIVAAGFTVRDLEATAALLGKAGFTVVRARDRVIVPAEEALGAVHYFIAG